ILQATDIATRLICEWGMSDTIGPVAYLQEQEGFLGGQSIAKVHSEKTAQIIDSEVKRVITECYEETRQLLHEYNTFLHTLAEALLVNETVDAEEVDIVLHCYMNKKKIEEGVKNQQERQHISKKNPRR
ncbi:MAG: cell division protein FtsH, partial [Desulfobulbaceae bacterium]|nr:cell division protein FtsH [Desulfobulbaceae bacterium]